MRDELRKRGERGYARTLLWVLAFAVAVVGGVALGAVRSPSAPIDQPVFVAGTLTYAWHGDPARGCAAEGLCGAHGSLMVHFDGYGDLTSAGQRGSASLNSASATVRVLRDDPSIAPGECVDVIPLNSVGVTLRRLNARNYTAIIDASPISAGRCAGPLTNEIARLTLPARRLAGRNLGFDLHGSTSFAGGPFSGQLISTVVLAPDTVDQGALTGQSSSSSSSGPPPRPPRVRHVLIEFAQLRYRITGASGALETLFAGAAQPYCVPLDNCGATGSLDVSVHGFRATLEITGTREVRRRVGRRRAVADLRAGRLQPGSPPLFSTANATVTEVIATSIPGTCRDTTRAQFSLLAGGPFVFGRSGSIIGQLGGPNNGTDPLRTHCPGPSSSDVEGGAGQFDPFSGGQIVASGTIAPESLGSPQVDLVLSDRGRFSGAAYSGQRAGSLVFSLSLTRVRAGTRRELVFG